MAEWVVWVFWRVDARWTWSVGAACSSRPGDDDDDGDDDDEEEEEGEGDSDENDLGESCCLSTRGWAGRGEGRTECRRKRSAGEFASWVVNQPPSSGTEPTLVPIC